MAIQSAHDVAVHDASQYCVGGSFQGHLRVRHAELTAYEDRDGFFLCGNPPYPEGEVGLLALSGPGLVEVRALGPEHAIGTYDRWLELADRPRRGEPGPGVFLSELSVPYSP
jgi:hypothetical protein